MGTLNCPLVSVIVPTLNEEKYIGLLLSSVHRQQFKNWEIIIVDGGSKDGTVDIAKKYGVKILVYPRLGEFASRNIGAKNAKGKYLLFTCADIIFPDNLFEKIVRRIQENPQLIALSGPGYPYDAPFLGKVEYIVFNLIKSLFSSLPKPLKRFSTSTNFLVVKKECFERTGGFVVSDINADGLMGRKLLSMGHVAFFPDMYFYLSARRIKKMGFLNFNKHYLYVLENFFFNLSRKRLLRAIKYLSNEKHRKMHDVS